MQSQPFSILHPFSDTLSVALFDRHDDIRGDADAARAMGLTDAAGLHQAHGREVLVVREPLHRTSKADGMITDQRNLALCIRWADCQNFVIYEPKKNIVGVLHVGWRCLLAGTIPSFFDLLQREWGATGKDVIVGAGPSLCLQCCSFTDPMRELPSMPDAFLHGRTADLRGWADQQFRESGVQSDRFERLPGCTRCEPETYWTYRGGHREQVKAGHTNMLAAGVR